MQHVSIGVRAATSRSSNCSVSRHTIDVEPTGAQNVRILSCDHLPTEGLAAAAAHFGCCQDDGHCLNLDFGVHTELKTAACGHTVAVLMTTKRSSTSTPGQRSISTFFAPFPNSTPQGSSQVRVALLEARALYKLPLNTLHHWSIQRW